MQLSDLLTTAATTGTAAITSPDHTAVASIGLDAAARLYAAVADDVDHERIGVICHDPGDLHVFPEDHAVVRVVRLRYRINPGAGADTVTLLCVAPGCPHPALGKTRHARVCEDHLTLITSDLRTIMYVPAKATGATAAQIRARRLDALQAEIDAAGASARFTLRRLREAAEPANT